MTYHLNPQPAKPKPRPPRRPVPPPTVSIPPPVRPMYSNAIQKPLQIHEPVFPDLPSTSALPPFPESPSKAEQKKPTETYLITAPDLDQLHRSSEESSPSDSVDTFDSITETSEPHSFSSDESQQHLTDISRLLMADHAESTTTDPPPREPGQPYVDIPSDVEGENEGDNSNPPPRIRTKVAPGAGPWFTFDDLPPARWRERLQELSAWLDLQMVKPDAELSTVLKEFRSDLHYHFKRMSALFHKIGGINDHTLKHVFLSSLPEELQPEIRRQIANAQLDINNLSLGRLFQLALVSLDYLCDQKKFFRNLMKDKEGFQTACKKPYLEIKCKDSKHCTCPSTKKHHKVRFHRKSSRTPQSRPFPRRPKKSRYFRRRQPSEILVRRRTKSRCFICKKLGHFAKECPKNPKRSQRLVQQLQSLHQFSPDTDQIEFLYSEQESPDPDTVFALGTSDSDSDSTSSTEPEDYSPVFHIQSVPSSSTQLSVQPIPSVKIQILLSKYSRPIPAIAFIDTGAQRSILNPAILPPETWISNENHFRAASGKLFSTKLRTKSRIGIQLFPKLTVWTHVIGSSLPDKDLLLGFDILFQAQKIQVLPTGLRFQSMFQPYTDQLKLYHLAQSPPDYQSISAQLLRFCPPNHLAFAHPHPLWKNPAHFVKLPFKLNEDLNPTKATHPGTPEEHQVLLQQFHDIIAHYGIMLSDKKSTIATDTVEYLGMQIKNGFYQPGPHIAQELLHFPDKDFTKKQVQQFLGIINYIRDFLPHVDQQTSILSALLKKNPISWDSRHTTAVQRLKQIAQNPPQLKIMTDGKRILQTDASDTSWGALLLEQIDKKEYLIGHASGHFSPAQQHYHTIYKEILAVKNGIKKFQSMFQPYTDQLKLYHLAQSPPDYQSISAQLLRFCPPNHLAFAHPHPLWKNPAHFVKLPFKLNEDLNPTKATHPGMPPSELQLAQTECAELLAQGLIEPTTSPWACQAFYVNKRAETLRGKKRLVIDYQPLNQFLQDDKFPLPRKNSIFTYLQNARIFSKFDLKSGFWQLGIDPAERYKTAFCIPNAHYQWTVLPFGLKTAPSIFQKAMTQIFQPLLHHTLVYIDDLLLFSGTPEEHQVLLQQFHDIIAHYGIMLSDKKSTIATDTVEYLGMQIKNGFYQPGPHIAQELLHFPDKDFTKKQVQQFLGIINYIRDFLPHVDQQTSILSALLKKNPISWDSRHTTAVQRLKQIAQNPPQLKIMTDGKRILQTDASDTSWGALLLEQIDKKEYLIGHASGHFSPAQQHYHTIYKEILAEWFSRYEFDVAHIKGQKNLIPDFLSRIQTPASPIFYTSPVFPIFMATRSTATSLPSKALTQKTFPRPVQTFPSLYRLQEFAKQFLFRYYMKAFFLEENPHNQFLTFHPENLFLTGFFIPSATSLLWTLLEWFSHIPQWRSQLQQLSHNHHLSTIPSHEAEKFTSVFIVHRPYFRHPETAAFFAQPQISHYHTTPHPSTLDQDPMFKKALMNHLLSLNHVPPPPQDIISSSIGPRHDMFMVPNPSGSSKGIIIKEERPDTPPQIYYQDSQDPEDDFLPLSQLLQEFQTPPEQGQSSRVISQSEPIITHPPSQCRSLCIPGIVHAKGCPQYDGPTYLEQCTLFCEPHGANCHKSCVNYRRFESSSSSDDYGMNLSSP
ncbi:hypothetical protein KPL70_014255 [Citrus sinensis]|nr:hypothetical protein KPL70_014255 [Citrus sinensis]